MVSAQLQEAKARLNLANSQYRRSQELNQQGFISSQARDETASQLQVAQATVALAQAQLDKTVIRAPFDGLVGLKSISVGDYVSPGSELVSIEAVDPLDVDFRVPEHYLANITVGLPIDVRLDSFPTRTYRGEVGAISPVVDATGRSLLLRAHVPNPNMVLRPGLFARVTLELGTDEVVMVPESAITPSGNAQYVYKVVNGIVQKVEVSVGLRREGWTEVLGVEADEQIVVLGTQKVDEGTAVNVVNH
ncbi:efflux RND transporter periplasmic adaptor subunit [Paenalcaligenes niemegkensis]|nr:efflux RND transporter periplasmic adaptor subunit [Paenalcaligenes niemegkensis]